MTSEWDYSNSLKSKIWKQLIAQMFTWQCARGLLCISFMKFKRPILQCMDLDEGNIKLDNWRDPLLDKNKKEIRQDRCSLLEAHCQKSGMNLAVGAY